MIRVKIRYNGKELASRLPKMKSELQNELSSIGLNISPDNMYFSNSNVSGYEISAVGDEPAEKAVVSIISKCDSIMLLNEFAEFIENNNNEFNDKITRSGAESLREMYREIFLKSAVKSDKLVINTAMARKETELNVKPFIVEKAIAMMPDEFFRFSKNLLDDNEQISENIDLMYQDKNGIQHCLLFYDKEGGDGIIVDSSGYNYARYCQYIPHAKELVEQHDGPKYALTKGETELHELLGKIVKKAAAFSHQGRSELCFDDILSELDMDIDDIKTMLIKGIAEILREMDDIKSVSVSDIGIPFQPEITVISSEDISADTEELSEDISGISIQ